MPEHGNTAKLCFFFVLFFGGAALSHFFSSAHTRTLSHFERDKTEESGGSATEEMTSSEI